MALLTVSSPLSPALLMKSNNPLKMKLSSSSGLRKRSDFRGFQVKAFFFNPSQDPLLREALKEPVAFMGGMFAGLLRLDLNEDPLKEWIARTVEASGITEEEINADDSKSDEEETPQQIVIE